MFGYLTGISCAILVAKIHKENPNFEVVDLVYRFFETYNQFDWKNPISLNGEQSHNLWKTQLDSAECMMQILCPNYELKNTTQRVQEPTFNTLLNEFKKGFDTL